jgi:hypothetical protein
MGTTVYVYAIDPDAQEPKWIESVFAASGVGVVAAPGN